jgi:hypothetical protein
MYCGTYFQTGIRRIATVLAVLIKNAMRRFLVAPHHSVVRGVSGRPVVRQTHRNGKSSIAVIQIHTDIANSAPPTTAHLKG